ncbi:MAG TPA: Trp family transcriptional regulator [Candidatus Andersenbacteria bacterium]|nr:Trp family transcriptional regulator [Candidatus Andersenbacteria bacterium]
MATFDYRELEPAERRRMLTQLAEVFATLKTADNIRFFLERLLTESELVMLARRLAVAELLTHGRTYEQIQRKLKVGVSTIRGVDRWLTDAAHEYHLIREHQRQEEQDAAWRKKRTPRHRSLLDHPNFPNELRGLIRGDSRMILFRLLLGDFNN